VKKEIFAGERGRKDLLEPSFSGGQKDGSFEEEKKRVQRRDP